MMKNETVRYSVVLGIITCIAAALLSLTYDKTKDAIAYVERQNFLNGLHAVLPEFDNDPTKDAVYVENNEIYVAKKDDLVVGYAMQTVTKKGYGGDILVLIGATPDGDIYNMVVIKHAETPGLGDKITSESFTGSFKGKSLAQKYAVKADGGDVDQFSGATVSPRAICDAVNIASPLILKAIRGESDE